MFKGSKMLSKEKIILVVGSLGLDRLLSVKTYPSPDSKVLTTSYNEVGGGTTIYRALNRHMNRAKFGPEPFILFYVDVIFLI